MTKRDHYICAALAGVVARVNYRADDPKEHVKAAMREADGAANEEADTPFRR